MKKILSVLILCVFILCGCSSDDEKNALPENEIVTESSAWIEPEVSEEITSTETEKVDKTETVVQVEEEIMEEPKQETTTVSLLVDCSDILNDMEALKKEKHDFVPDGGIILSVDNAEFTEGESVFDILKRELVSHSIHLEFNMSPVFKNAYIEGIGNIYEFDCGERSGWKYTINGKFPPVGCSDYKVKAGDKIVFLYKIKAY